MLGFRNRSEHADSIYDRVVMATVEGHLIRPLGPRDWLGDLASKLFSSHEGPERREATATGASSKAKETE